MKTTYESVYIKIGLIRVDRKIIHKLFVDCTFFLDNLESKHSNALLSLHLTVFDLQDKLLFLTCIQHEKRKDVI